MNAAPSRGANASAMLRGRSSSTTTGASAAGGGVPASAWGATSRRASCDTASLPSASCAPRAAPAPLLMAEVAHTSSRKWYSAVRYTASGGGAPRRTAGQGPPPPPSASSSSLHAANCVSVHSEPSVKGASGERPCTCAPLRPRPAATAAATRAARAAGSWISESLPLPSDAPSPPHVDECSLPPPPPLLSSSWWPGAGPAAAVAAAAAAAAPPPSSDARASAPREAAAGAASPPCAAAAAAAATAAGGRDTGWRRCTSESS